MKEYFFVVSNLPEFYGWLLAIYPANKLDEALQHPGLESECVDLMRVQWKGFGTLPHKMTHMDPKKAATSISNEIRETRSWAPIMEMLVDEERDDYDAERGEE